MCFLDHVKRRCPLTVRATDHSITFQLLELQPEVLLIYAAKFGRDGPCVLMQWKILLVYCYYWYYWQWRENLWRVANIIKLPQQICQPSIKWLGHINRQRTWMSNNSGDRNKAVRSGSGGFGGCCSSIGCSGSEGHPAIQSGRVDERSRTDWSGNVGPIERGSYPIPWSRWGKQNHLVQQCG